MRKDAFTIAEVMIVIVMIVLITALIIPSIWESRQKNGIASEDTTPPETKDGKTRIFPTDKVWNDDNFNASVTTVRHYGHYYIVIHGEGVVHAPWCPCGGIPEFVIKDQQMISERFQAEVLEITDTTKVNTNWQATAEEKW